MLILLSPAKTMTGTSKIKAPQGTTPRFQQEANEIALHMTQFPIDELSRQAQPETGGGMLPQIPRFSCGRQPALTSDTRLYRCRIQEYQPERLHGGGFSFLARTYAFRIGMLRVTSPIRPYQALPDGVRRKNPGTRRREYVRLLEGQANKYINP